MQLDNEVRTMRVKELHIENFRGIKHLCLEINSNGAVIYGMNGVGKTTIIEALNLVISRILDRALHGKIVSQGALKEEDVRFGSSFIDIKVCFELEDEEFTVNRVYSKSKKSAVSNQKSLHKLSTQLRNIMEDESNTGDLPIYVLYGVNRSVVDIPLRIRNKHSFDRKYTYEKSSIGTDFRTFFEWYTFV